MEPHEVRVSRNISIPAWARQALDSLDRTERRDVLDAARETIEAELRERGFEPSGR